MDPNSEGEHVFVFRNEGDAPLKLSDGGTTCECTLAEMPRGEIPPGEEVPIKVTWTTRLDGLFRQTATIRTNDPLTKNVRLTIEGLIRRRVGVFPPKMTFDSVSLDNPDRGKFIVYSQVWDSLDVHNLHSDWDGLTWDIQPMTPADIERQLPNADVKCGYVVDVQLPHTAKPGMFNHWLRMDAYGVEAEDHKELKVRMVGKVLRRLCVYGESIEPTGDIDAGILREGLGNKLKLMLQVRDVVKEMSVVGIKTEPKFIKANVVPRNYGLGLYTLELEIPKDAPPCYHMGLKTGKLNLEIDHPRIKELKLGVKFCVMKR